MYHLNQNNHTDEPIFFFKIGTTFYFKGFWVSLAKLYGNYLVKLHSKNEFYTSNSFCNITILKILQSDWSRVFSLVT